MGVQGLGQTPGGGGGSIAMGGGATPPAFGSSPMMPAGGSPMMTGASMPQTGPMASAGGSPMMPSASASPSTLPPGMSSGWGGGGSSMSGLPPGAQLPSQLSPTQPQQIQPNQFSAGQGYGLGQVPQLGQQPIQQMQRQGMPGMNPMVLRAMGLG